MTLRLLLAPLCLFAASPGLHAVSAADDSPHASPASVAPLPIELAHLPAGNPYRSVLLALHSLSADQRRQLGAWASLPPPSDDTETSATPEISREARLSAEVRARADQLAATLIAIASPAEGDPAHWPLALPLGESFNTEGTMLPELDRAQELGRIALAVSAHQNPNDALRAQLAVARLGRHLRHGRSLVHQLSGTALIDAARTEAARRLDEFSPVQLHDLGSAWRALPAAPGIDETIALEHERLLAPFVRRELIPLAEAWSAAGFSSRPSLARRLRAPGLAKETLARAGEFERAVEFLLLDPLQNLFTRTPPDEKQRAAMDDWLARLRAHRPGPGAFFEDLIQRHGPFARTLARTAEQPVAPELVPSSGDPLLDLFTSPFATVPRALRASETADLMLQAAIHHRLTEQGRPPGAPAPNDPWARDGAPFAHARTPGDGFILRSAYERTRGRPLAFEFATPHAGLTEAP